MSAKLKLLNPDNVPSAVGIAWFTKESYPKCLAIFDDPTNYPNTFDEWFIKVQKIEKEYCRLGVRVVRVKIDPNTFPDWCTENGFSNVDAEARSHYASLQAAIEVSH